MRKKWRKIAELSSRNNRSDCISHCCGIIDLKCSRRYICEWGIRTIAQICIRGVQCTEHQSHTPNAMQ